MLATIKEAMNLVCVRHIQDIEKGIIIWEQDGCLSSRCMGWRWWLSDGKEKGERRRGYCGLAGKPMLEEQWDENDKRLP